MLEKAVAKIKKYTEDYRAYFEEVYKDSWIWSEDTIIQTYLQESENRYLEIRTILKTKLESEVISYKNNSAIIKWKSKILLVTFKDNWNSRTITDIEIR